MEKSEEKMCDDAMKFAVSIHSIISRSATTVIEQLSVMYALEVVLYANLLLNGFPEEKLQEYLDRNHKEMMDAIKMFIRENDLKGSCKTPVGDA